MSRRVSARSLVSASDRNGHGSQGEVQAPSLPVEELGQVPRPRPAECSEDCRLPRHYSSAQRRADMREQSSRGRRPLNDARRHSVREPCGTEGVDLEATAIQVGDLRRNW